MAITFVKKKVLAKPAVVVSDFAAIIDQAGVANESVEDITNQIKALTAKLKPHKEKLYELQKAIDEMDLDPDAEGFMQYGEGYQLEIGKKGSSRKIKDMALVQKAMGKELFMKVATVTLKEIDKYLTLPQREQLLTTDRTSRSYKLSARE